MISKEDYRPIKRLCSSEQRDLARDGQDSPPDSKRSECAPVVLSDKDVKPEVTSHNTLNVDISVGRKRTDALLEKSRVIAVLWLSFVCELGGCGGAPSREAWDSKVLLCPFPGQQECKKREMHMRGCHVFCASMHQLVPYGKTQDL